jgi:hypothetical protein
VRGSRVGRQLHLSETFVSGMKSTSLEDQNTVIDGTFGL